MPSATLAVCAQTGQPLENPVEQKVRESRRLIEVNGGFGVVRIEHRGPGREVEVQTTLTERVKEAAA